VKIANGKEYTAREIMEMQNKLKTFLPEWEPVS
jgi:hypothetical protein